MNRTDEVNVFLARCRITALVDRGVDRAAFVMAVALFCEFFLALTVIGAFIHG